MPRLPFTTTGSPRLLLLFGIVLLVSLCVTTYICLSGTNIQSDYYLKKISFVLDQKRALDTSKQILIANRGYASQKGGALRAKELAFDAEFDAYNAQFNACIQKEMNQGHTLILVGTIGQGLGVVLLAFAVLRNRQREHAN